MTHCQSSPLSIVSTVSLTWKTVFVFLFICLFRFFFIFSRCLCCFLYIVNFLFIRLFLLSFASCFLQREISLSHINRLTHLNVCFGTVFNSFHSFIRRYILLDHCPASFFVFFSLTLSHSVTSRMSFFFVFPFLSLSLLSLRRSLWQSLRSLSSLFLTLWLFEFYTFSQLLCKHFSLTPLLQGVVWRLRCLFLAFRLSLKSPRCLCLRALERGKGREKESKAQLPRVSIATIEKGSFMRKLYSCVIIQNRTIRRLNYIEQLRTLDWTNMNFDPFRCDFIGHSDSSCQVCSQAFFLSLFLPFSYAPSMWSLIYTSCMLSSPLFIYLSPLCLFEAIEIRAVSGRLRCTCPLAKWRPVTLDIPFHTTLVQSFEFIRSLI